MSEEWRRHMREEAHEGGAHEWRGHMCGGGTCVEEEEVSS